MLIKAATKQTPKQQQQYLGDIRRGPFFTDNAEGNKSFSGDWLLASEIFKWTIFAVKLFCDLAWSEDKQAAILSM